MADKKKKGFLDRIGDIFNSPLGDDDDKEQGGTRRRARAEAERAEREVREAAERTEDKVREAVDEAADKTRSVFQQAGAEAEAAQRAVEAEASKRAEEIEDAARGVGIDKDAARKSVYGAAAARDEAIDRLEEATKRAEEAAAAAESASAEAVAETRTHTVASGDTLSAIAKQYYGDAAQWPKIYQANKDKIENPDLIYPGQEFIIPD